MSAADRARVDRDHCLALANQWFDYARNVLREFSDPYWDRGYEYFDQALKHHETFRNLTDATDRERKADDADVG